MLKCFQSHPEHIILQTNKNLGPCVMNREYYIRQYVTHHVSNEKCYEIIDESTAQERMNKSMNDFLHCIKESSLKLHIED